MNRQIKITVPEDCRDCFHSLSYMKDARCGLFLDEKINGVKLSEESILIKNKKIPCQACLDATITIEKERKYCKCVLRRKLYVPNLKNGYEHYKPEFCPHCGEIIINE